MCSVKTAVLYTLVYCVKPELNPQPAVVPVEKKGYFPSAVTCLVLSLPLWLVPPEFVMLCASLFSLYNAGFVVLSCKPHFQQQVQQQQYPTM